MWNKFQNLNTYAPRVSKREEKEWRRKFSQRNKDINKSQREIFKLKNTTIIKLSVNRDTRTEVTKERIHELRKR